MSLSSAPDPILKNYLREVIQQECHLFRLPQPSVACTAEGVRAKDQLQIELGRVENHDNLKFSS